jgi:hypothetical protein
MPEGVTDHNFRLGKLKPMKTVKLGCKGNLTELVSRKKAKTVT